MGKSLKLLEKYPKTSFNIEDRRRTKSANNILLARQFGKDYFDGEKRHGYGGYVYRQSEWKSLGEKICQHFQLTAEQTVLDIGCAKGFLLHALSVCVPSIKVKGVDVSSYAIANGLAQMKPHLQVGNATNLPFPDNHFDLVLSFNTLHNLTQSSCVQALKEIQRVSKGDSFIVVAAYQTTQQQVRLHDWNLTAKMIAHVQEWKALFHKSGYTGDYDWFCP